LAQSKFSRLLLTSKRLSKMKRHNKSQKMKNQKRNGKEMKMVLFAVPLCGVSSKHQNGKNILIQIEKKRKKHKE